MVIKRFAVIALLTALNGIHAAPTPQLFKREDQLSLSVDSSTVKFDVAQGVKSSSRLNPQLISLSIELGNTIDFFGDVGKPNEFSRQLLQNIVDRSGTSPVLRLGGNTQDKTEFCENCPDTLHSIIKVDPSNPLSTEAVNVTINGAFFQVMEENVPPTTQYIFGLNFGNNTYETAQTEIDGALKYLDQSRVLAYELGNEANLYGSYTNKRPKNWTVVDYGKQMLEWIPQLSARTAGSPPNFQLGSFVGPPTYFGDFSLLQLTKMGVPQNIEGVKYIASYGYPGNVCTNASAAQVQLPDYVNHLKTVEFVTQYQGEIVAAKSAGTVFHIGETNSAGCHGMDGVSNTMGALLWEIDYALLGATLGVDRLFFHNGKGGFYYSMWEPLPLDASTPAHINPTYYSMLFIADLVSGMTVPTISRIVELDTYDLAHYAVYDGHGLRKLVLLNTHYHNGTTETRPSHTLDVSSVLGRNIKFRRLAAANTVAKSGITWAGQYVDSSGHITGDSAVEHASDGLIRLLASEAVIVETD
ncbi:glycoside hydrolase family 79 protein [Zopfia rhizophila CBS 207.26]|uniref:Glycoside hydrolase family 79 protein n=1 Tax=Zopfia rhizophila CBS 207.26 TaxID=1314779 RepID=A0A6A6DMX1_9PEZI|nr:glycoside hydrolase family 79 protein [Zopfia rhizophila CBS 207.26]